MPTAGLTAVLGCSLWPQAGAEGVPGPGQEHPGSPRSRSPVSCLQDYICPRCESGFIEELPEETRSGSRWGGRPEAGAAPS